MPYWKKFLAQSFSQSFPVLQKLLLIPYVALKRKHEKDRTYKFKYQVYFLLSINGPEDVKIVLAAKKRWIK